MLRHLLILPDGREIFSGASGAAVQQVKLTRTVNEGQQLAPGAVCAAMLEVTLTASADIQAGDALTVFTVDDSGDRRQLGIFLAEKPERRSAHTLQVTAYDRLTLLDRDLSRWLAGLDGWPYTLRSFAEMVCDACGLTLLPGELPNGDFPVEAFTAEGVTGRQLMMWIGQVACRFCRATPQGEVAFGWYTPASLQVGPSPIPMAEADWEDGQLRLTVRDGGITETGALDAPSVRLSCDGQGNATLTFAGLSRQYCFQGGITLAEYATAPIEKVQLRQDEEDVGTVFPSDDTEEKNTFRITGNPLLAARTAQALQPVAQTLYGQLSQICYTPGTLKLPASSDLQPGDILQVTDPEGRTVSFYVMTAERSGQADTLSCVGEQYRDSTAAFNDVTYAPLGGKVLRLRTDVEGIRAENADTAGRMTRLELDVGGIRGQVEVQQSEAEGLRTQLTQLQQTAETISATVQTITQQGAQKLQNSFGLTIDGSAVEICRSTSDMKNRLDEKGMSVIRGADTASETVMLRADAQGVLATDVSVRNFLIIGDYARLEDYTDGADSRRTACFFLGGE